MGSDIARYWALKNYGGLYIDIDYVIRKDLSYLLEFNDMIVGMMKTYQPYWINNSFIASIPNHRIIIEVLRLVNNNVKFLN